jgi:glyoxylase-like metal-dependent hydrolase (beta-lactamase superfamily II)
MPQDAPLKVEFVPGLTKRPEFGEMFGGFLAEYRDMRLLVDCGTASGGQDLTERLKERLQGRKLDLVLLTHAHLDHSGGLGAVFEAWPKVRAVVHAQAVQHLANPIKLWSSTRQVMGELAEVYGEPQEVDPARLISHKALGFEKLKILETPGHAAHHLSYVLADTLFAGEAAGCPFWRDSRFLSRPATPPRFFPEPALNSMKLLAGLNIEEGYFAHTHEKGPVAEAVRAYSEQLDFWSKIIRSRFENRNPHTPTEEIFSELTDLLFEQDPNLQPLKSLDPVSLKTEKYFMQNSVAGIWGYYEEEDHKAACRRSCQNGG